MNIVEKAKSFYRNAVLSGAALEDYLVAAILFVVIGVAVSVGAYITGTIQNTVSSLTNTCTGVNVINTQSGFCAGAGANALVNNGFATQSTAYNAAGQSVTGMGTFAQWLPILAIVVVAVVIIALLYGFLVGGAGRGGAQVA